ncbi:MAG: hypothetical protein ABI954_05725 [Pyrinomonadaceae bacterium]
MSDEFNPVRSKAVEIALVEAAKHVKESGGQNRGPEIDVYLKNAHAPLEKHYGWCGMFIYYCYSQAANRCGRILPFSAGNLWSGQKLAKWSLSNQDKIVYTSPILPGDIYVMNSYHIGMVTDTMTDSDIIRTVDGNQTGGNAKGDSLKLRTRHFSDMRLFIRI